MSFRNFLCGRRLLPICQMSRRLASISTKRDSPHLTRFTPSEPPLPIRVALVSSSTTLCTPIFPAIGFVNICLRFMLPNEKLRSQLSASIGSILSFACWTIVPFSYEIAPLMLPFAISNGISAGVGYAIIDVSTGGPKNSSILKNPILTGGGIGAFTGLVAPNYLYGEAYNVLYGIDSVTPLIGQVMAVPFVSQISCTTGFVAGCAMYPLLHYPIFGIKNFAWTGFSGVLLVLSAATVYTIYKTDVNKHDMIAPVGSFCKPDMVPLLNTIVRYNTQTKQFESYSVTTKEWVGDPIVCDKGSDMADSIRSYQKNSDSWGQTYTFDNPMLSYLCHYFDRAIAERFPENIVSLKDKQVLSEDPNAKDY